MSKTRLKKELSTFTNEQLVEVILSAYDSSKEAKAYFEFFLNPDADAFIEKKTEEIAREIRRVRRGRIAKFRGSFIRATIKGVADYGIGPEYVANLMYKTLVMLAEAYNYFYYSATQLNAVGKLAADYLRYANDHEILSEATANIDSLCNGDIGNKEIRSLLREAAGIK